MCCERWERGRRGGGGMPYEVPIQSKRQSKGRDESAGRGVEMAYQHKNYNPHTTQ